MSDRILDGVIVRHPDSGKQELRHRECVGEPVEIIHTKPTLHGPIEPVTCHACGEPVPVKGA